MEDKILYKYTPLVSIVIPTYNRKHVIGKAIDSCLRQTYANIEVIICDDHSTDGTEPYILDRIRMDPRIRYCKNPKRKKGANAARNTAIKIANGKFIAFLDTDDFLLDDSIENRIRIFAEDKRIALVYGNVYSEKHGKISKWIYHDLYQEKVNQRKYLMENMALCIQNSIMVRTEVLKQIGLLDEAQKAWTDDGLVVAVGMKYRICHCGKFLSVNRKSEISMTKNKWNMYEGCRMMVHKYKRQIIRYASLQRYILWKIRLFSAFCYAKESDYDSGIQKKIWQFLHEKIRNRIRPYFKIYCE